MVPIGVTGGEGHRGLDAFTHIRMPSLFRHHRFVLVLVVVILLPNRVISGGLDQPPQLFLLSY